MAEAKPAASLGRTVVHLKGRDQRCLQCPSPGLQDDSQGTLPARAGGGMSLQFGG